MILDTWRRDAAAADGGGTATTSDGCPICGRQHRGRGPLPPRPPDGTSSRRAG